MQLSFCFELHKNVILHVFFLTYFFSFSILAVFPMLMYTHVDVHD